MSNLPSEAEQNRHIRYLLVQYLRDCGAENKTATYQEMDALTGIDIRACRSKIGSAMADVLNEFGFAFKTVRGVGYKPIASADAIGFVGRSARQKIKNETGRWRDRFNAIPKNNLTSQEDLNNLIRENLRLNAHEELHSQQLTDRVEAAVESVSAELSPERMKQILLKAQRALSHVG